MKRRNDPNVIRTQTSVSFFPDGTGTGYRRRLDPAQYAYELYPRMLIEDLHNGIMPIGGRSRKKNFKVSVTPSNREVEILISKALSEGEYYRDLSGSVCAFVSDCAVQVLLFGSAVYEIVSVSEKVDGKEVEVGFELSLVPGKTVIQKGRSLVQILPADLAKKLGKTEQIDLNPEKIISFNIPPEYRGKNDTMFEALAVLSSPLIPPFVVNDMAKESSRTPYNATSHILSHNLAVARATRLVGWNARQLFQKDPLEYYLIRRRLRFEEFKIKLRERIIDDLDRGIERSCRRLGHEARIRVEGLPTIRDLQIANEHLQKGDVSFAALLEPFNGY